MNLTFIQKLWLYYNIIEQEKQDFDKLLFLEEHNAMFQNPKGVQKVRNSRLKSSVNTKKTTNFDEMIQKLKNISFDQLNKNIDTEDNQSKITEDNQPKDIEDNQLKTIENNQQQELEEIEISDLLKKFLEKTDKKEDK